MNTGETHVSKWALMYLSHPATQGEWRNINVMILDTGTPRDINSSSEIPARGPPQMAHGIRASSFGATNAKRFLRGYKVPLPTCEWCRMLIELALRKREALLQRKAEQHMEAVRQMKVAPMNPDANLGRWIPKQWKGTP